jgi:hypothetical protein
MGRQHRTHTQKTNDAPPSAAIAKGRGTTKGGKHA